MKDYGIISLNELSGTRFDTALELIKEGKGGFLFQNVEVANFGKGINITQISEDLDLLKNKNLQMQLLTDLKQKCELKYQRKMRPFLNLSRPIVLPIMCR